MPKIKIDHIISFSSEDSVHIANNLLLDDPTKKWKCQKSGEKSATIVLQLERACLISGMDIGNENSAYVEVLVARAGMGDEYKVFLVMSSLMKPLEARQGTNVNTVRFFKKEHFSKPECDQKWDRVKIVCTQPFNRHVQYGLSFVTFHTTEEVKGSAVETVPTLGRFTLRPKSPDNFSAGSLFARRKEQKSDNTPLSVAAAIRKASVSTSPLPKRKLIDLPMNNSKASENSDVASTSFYNDIEMKESTRNRKEILYDKDEEEYNEKIDKIMEKRNKEKEEQKIREEKEKKEKEEKKKKHNDEKKNQSQRHR